VTSYVGTADGRCMCVIVSKLDTSARRFRVRLAYAIRVALTARMRDESSRAAKLQIGGGTSKVHRTTVRRVIAVGVTAGCMTQFRRQDTKIKSF
jgi:hypothetical protein